MNSLTAYALAVEMADLLAGRSISALRRHHAGCCVILDEGLPSNIQIIHNRREAEIFFPPRPIVSESRSLPALEQACGMKITSVRPLGLDRVIDIGLEGKDQWGKPSLCTLRIDLAPGMKAVSLFEEPGGRLLGCLGGRKSRAPSSPLELPPPKRWSLLDLPGEVPGTFSAAVLAAESGDGDDDRARSLSDILVSTVSGIDPVLASILTSGNTGMPGGDADEIWSFLSAIGSRISKGEFEWNIYDFPETKKGGLCNLYPVSLPVGARPEKANGLLEAFESRSTEMVVPGMIDDLRRDVTRPLRKEIRRTRKLIEGLDRDLGGAEAARQNRHFGNLLTNSRHLLRRGLERVSVPDYSTQASIEIPLDPAITPDENIKRYFKKARKGEKGILIIRERRAQAKRGLKKLEEELEKMERIDSIDRLLEILPVPGEERREEKARAGEPPRFRSFRLDDDHVIYVGRSDGENDTLTHRFASPSDLWFHAQGLPGSHVILKGAGRSTPRSFIEAAAGVAAYFSKGRSSSTVAVIFTEKRYVRKPRGTRPGTASCIREKTLFVAPQLPETE